MRTRFPLARLAPLALAAVATLGSGALAGEGECGAFGDCRNACPLAKQANERRSTGTEAVLASKAVQKHEIARVLGNLGRV
jgi:hypothetical protein